MKQADATASSNGLADRPVASWLRDRSLGTKAVLMLSSLVVLMTLSAASLLYGEAQIRDARRWSDHTYSVLSSTHVLETLLFEQVANLRGYERTPLEEYRRSFNEAREAFDRQLQRLRTLTADNADQRARLQRIADLSAQWHAVYTGPSLNLASDPKRHQELLAFIAQQRGKPYRVALKSAIDDVANVEQVLLDKRSATLTETLTRLRWMAVILMVLGFAVCLLILIMVRRVVSQPLGRLRRNIDLQSAGDLGTPVPDQRGGDEIGAIARAIEAFRLVSIEARRREWIKTEVSQLSRLLSARGDDASFGHAVLAHLCPLLGAGYGILYRVQDREPRAIASFGFDLAKSEAHQNRYALARQVVLDGKAIHLDAVPPDYTRIASGVGSAAPRCVYLLPLRGASGVVGIIELACFSALTPTASEMLDEASPLTGLALEALGNALRTQELLEETRVQAEELQSSEESLRVQAEELRTTNEALADKGRALNEFNERLVAFQAELEVKNQDLENASRYKSEFLANMSHELRTPLNSLLILAKDLSDNGNGNLDAEQVESAQIILDSGTKLLNLINDILDLSKIEAGRMDVNWESCELAPLLTSIDRQFRRTASQRGITLDVRVDASLPPRIVSDGGKLNQILVNLVGNALKFTQHGSVSVEIARPDAQMPLLPGIGANETIALSVSDTGIGISEEQLARLFQPFEQADGTTSRRFGGTGLGLSISRALAKMIGGDIVVRSAPDQGSRFTLLLPEMAEGAERVSEPVSGAANPAGAASSNPAPAVAAVPRMPAPAGNDDRALIAPGEITILIAEDDSAFARVLADIARRKGYRALIAGDGPTALDLARRYKPQGILLDVGLPLLDGWQVLEQLKADPALRHIPAHFITATDDAARGLALGAVGFLTKPATREALDEAFSRVLHFADGRRRKLLIIDDESAARTAVSRLLAGQAVDIVEAGTAAEALEQLRQHSFDCIILDLSLPDASGFELLEQLSQRGTVPPVVIYSARELSRDENLRLREYTDSIVIKGAQSPGRLLDEVTLFLHAVRSPTTSDRQNGDLAGRTVLIVDDDMRNVFALSKALRAQGLQVVIAQDGHKALAQLEQNSGIECVLMDVMMPGMDGYEATRQIRARPQWKQLPIIAVTAKAMKGDREKCLEAGANDYLTKPIDLDKLLSMLRAWLHRD